MSDQATDRLRALRDRLDVFLGRADKGGAVYMAEEIQAAAWAIARGEPVYLYETLLLRGEEELRFHVLLPSHIDAERRGEAMAANIGDGWSFHVATSVPARDLLKGEAI